MPDIQTASGVVRIKDPLLADVVLFSDADCFALIANTFSLGSPRAPRAYLAASPISNGPE